MTNLFADELFPADVVGRITEAYREKLLLNPPTPSFNVRTNPNAEGFARRIAPKDITRLLAVLGEMGLEIVPKQPDPLTNGHGSS